MVIFYHRSFSVRFAFPTFLRYLPQRLSDTPLTYPGTYPHSVLPCPNDLKYNQDRSEKYEAEAWDLGIASCS